MLGITSCYGHHSSSRQLWASLAFVSLASACGVPQLLNRSRSSELISRDVCSFASTSNPRIGHPRRRTKCDRPPTSHVSTTRHVDLPASAGQFLRSRPRTLQPRQRASPMFVQAHIPLCRHSSADTPGPSRSANACLRPDTTMSNDNADPLTSGPSPITTSASLARNRIPAIRCLPPPSDTDVRA